MAQQNVGINRERTLPDYLSLAANALYVLAGLSFVGGLLIDWLIPGRLYITPLVITTETPNSGLFIVSIALLLAGYILSVIGSRIEEYRRETVDQTQEWTVDVGNR